MQCSWGRRATADSSFEAIRYTLHSASTYTVVHSIDVHPESRGRACTLEREKRGSWGRLVDRQNPWREERRLCHARDLCSTFFPLWTVVVQIGEELGEGGAEGKIILSREWDVEQKRAPHRLFSSGERGCSPELCRENYCTVLYNTISNFVIIMLEYEDLDTGLGISLLEESSVVVTSPVTASLTRPRIVQLCSTASSSSLSSPPSSVSLSPPSSPSSQHNLSFGSQMVDRNSSTPYTDATQVR